MTANHAHTPTTEQIELLVLAQLKQSAERHGLPHDIEADRADFRRWYNGEIAAAEQRGAKRELVELSTHLIKREFPAGHHAGIQTALHEIARRLIEITSADQEGDDEQV